MKKLIRFIVRKIPRPLLIRFSGLFSLLVRPFYLGNSVECPICRGKFRKFLPYGNQGAENRLCPKCLSLERHRLMWLYLTKYTPFFTDNLNVLHIAPEQPFIKKFKKMRNLNYQTADLVSPIADLHFDIMDIPLEDERYDVVFCNHVLEHVQDDKVAAKEVFRILKKGGWAILQVPIDYTASTTFEDPAITHPKEREKAFGQYDHVRLHGLDYPKRLESTGFMVEYFDIKEHLSPDLMDRYRLDKSEILYIAIKRHTPEE